jgi:type I restriction enzyme S subunit
MDNWQKNDLSELTLKITKGTTPSQAMGGFSTSGVNYIKAESVMHSGVIDTSKFQFITNDNHEKLKRSQLAEDDILFSMAGMHLGKTAMVKSEHLPANTNQALSLIRCDRSKVYPKFVFYSLRRSEVLHFAQNSTSQSAQPNINLTDIGSISIRYPDLKEQKAIAHVLGTLDDKIELNQKMNQTLEDIAKAIFKSWFVDFDPVRAKAAGHPTGLPGEIGDLFPDAFEDSEIGRIPAGWQVSVVSSFGSVVCGKTPSTKDHENFDGAYPFITIPDMRGNILSLETDRTVSEKGAKALKGKMLPPGSVCVSCIATPGLVCVTTKKSFTNQQINSIVPYVDAHKEYLAFSMMTFGELISSAGSGGSVFANLSTGRFKDLPILRPHERIVGHFSEIIRPILERIELAQKEILVLTELRDTLLPKLISGELRIPNAEKFIEEAGI